MFVCEVMVGLVSMSAVLVCESFSNYFNSVGSSVGEDITCVDGLNSCNFASLDTVTWCAMCWVDRVGRMQLGVTESESPTPSRWPNFWSTHFACNSYTAV